MKFRGKISLNPLKGLNPAINRFLEGQFSINLSNDFWEKVLQLSDQTFGQVFDQGLGQGKK